MSFSLWEKIRGYDKWTPADAFIQAPESNPSARAGLDENSTWDGDILVWTDHLGTRHSAEFSVPDDCNLYQKVAGDRLAILYNPRNPAEFYHRQLHQVRVRTTLKRILIAASIVGLVIMALWVREKP